MRPLFLIFFSLLPLLTAAQKRVTVVADGLFSFDPISSRYVVRSLSPVATYVEAWRAEGHEVEVKVLDSLWFGYRFYCAEIDTSLKNRVLAYLKAEIQTDTTVSVVDISGFPHSREFAEAFDADIERIRRFYATPIKVFDTIKRYNPYAPSDFMSLFHTFQIEVSGADLSIVAPPSRQVALQKECYIRHLVNLLRYDNELVVVKLTGRQIKDMMEESYSRQYYQVKDEGDDLLKIYTPAYLYFSIAPVSHTVNLTKSAGHRIENWPLGDDTIYSVALNSFAARQIKIEKRVGDYKTLLIKWLYRSHNPFSIVESRRLQPARIVEKIVEREEQTIFGK